MIIIKISYTLKKHQTNRQKNDADYEHEIES